MTPGKILCSFVYNFFCKSAGKFSGKFSGQVFGQVFSKISSDKISSDVKRSRSIQVGSLSMVLLVTVFLSSACSKLAATPGAQNDSRDEAGKTESCVVPFLKENLEGRQNADGLLLINGWYLKVPEAETRCRVSTNLAASVSGGASLPNEQVGYPYLILLPRLEADDDIRLEASGGDLEFSVSLQQTLPNEDEKQKIAQELGFSGEVGDAFKIEIPEIKYVLFDQLVAERFQILNDVNGRGLFGLAHFSLKKADFLKNILAQIKKGGSLTLLADSQEVYPFNSISSRGFLVYELAMSNSLFSSLANELTSSLPNSLVDSSATSQAFTQSSNRPLTKLRFLDYLQFAKVNWSHAEVSPFSDDLVRALELVAIYARSLPAQDLIKEFPAAFRICSETWTPLPPRSLVLAGEFGFYRASFELLSLMDSKHPVNKVNERRLKLVTLGTLNATEGFLVALDTLTTRLLDDAQFAKALMAAQQLKSVVGTGGGFSAAIYLGERLSWDDVKMLRAAKILKLGSRELSLQFTEMLDSALKYAGQDLSAEQEKSLAEAMNYLNANPSGGVSGSKSKNFSDAFVLVFEKGFSVGDSSLLRDFTTWLQSGFGVELDRKTASDEALFWVLAQRCDRNVFELLKDVFTWMTSPFAVEFSKPVAYQKLKVLKSFKNFNRKRFEQMRDLFSQISNTYAESYPKGEAFEKTRFWLLQKDFTQDQMSLRKEAFVFLSGLYSAGLKKEVARDKAEDWIVNRALSRDKLTKIRDLFIVYNRTMDKQKALARAEREVF